MPAPYAGILRGPRRIGPAPTARPDLDGDPRGNGRLAPRLVTDVLATQAGISLYDDLGSFYKLNMGARGYNAGPTVGLPPGVSVFLDRVRQNEPSAQEVNFDLLPVEHVDRIEFLRGNASLLGPNSLAGAVNLIARRGGGPLEGEMELSGGSFGRLGAGADIAGELGTGWTYFAGGGYEEEAGWREATHGRRFSGLVNAGRSVGRGGIRIQALWSDSRGETAGSLPESIYDVDRKVNFTAGDFEALQLQQLTLSGYHPAFGGQGSATTYFRRTDAERFNVNQPPESDVRSLSENTTVGGAVDWSRRLPLRGPAIALRAGIDAALSWSQVRIFEEDRDGPQRELTTDVESPRVDLAAFVLADLELGRATVSAGARLDHMQIPFQDVLDPSADTTNTFTRLSPRGGLNLDLGSGSRAFGSVGLSFRAPAILELACSDPEDACPLPFALGDDPPLDPVTATNYEIGAGWRRGGTDLAASFYRIDVNDEIFGTDELERLLTPLAKRSVRIVVRRSFGER